MVKLLPVLIILAGCALENPAARCEVYKVTKAGLEADLALIMETASQEEILRRQREILAMNLPIAVACSQGE